MKRTLTLTGSLLFAVLIVTCCHSTVSWDSGDPGQPKILWGIGNEIPRAKEIPLYSEAPVRMITSWYNTRDDTAWMKSYMRGSTMSDLYGKGYAQELVIWLQNYPDYAISPDFLSDAALLARIFKGNGPNYGPLYVVMYTEFETYSQDSTYFPKLVDNFLKARDTMKAVYPKAEVALGFGGYGWSHIKHRDFKDYEIKAINAGDFIAVQEMQRASNLPVLIDQVRNSIKQLSTFGKPIMISHFRIWREKNDPERLDSDTFYQFIQQMFNWRSLDTLANEGVFAWDFMDDNYITDPSPAYQAIKGVIKEHASLDPNLPGQ